MTTSVTVPVAGDEAFKAVFKAFSIAQGRPMAELVREAIDAKFGDAMEPHRVFFEQVVIHNLQSSIANDKTRSSSGYAGNTAGGERRMK